MRHLNLHEYQSKDLLESFGCVVQRGRMAASAADAGSVAASLVAANAGAELVLKAQIHAGGRGKGVFDNGYKGGVKICKTPAEVSAAAARMLGARLVTKQTGPAGQLVSKVLVNEGIAIHRELYFAILMDRAHGGPVLVASTQGGMDIEEVAEKHPGAIVSRTPARARAPGSVPLPRAFPHPLARPPARPPAHPSPDHRARRHYRRAGPAAGAEAGRQARADGRPRRQGGVAVPRAVQAVYRH